MAKKPGKKKGGQGAPQNRPPEALPLRPPRHRNELLRGGLLLAAVLVCFWPSLGGGFLWDDDLWIAREANTPTLRLMHDDRGLSGIWFTTQAMDYWPLSNSAYWAQWRLWGMNATGYRVVNLLLHALGSILIWRVLKRLRVPGAWLGAMLFAIHPVTVASVAWIAELRNCLALPLYASALLVWLWFDESGRWRWYIAALLLFVLAMLAKPSTVVLPVILLICAWWQRGKIGRQDILRTSPFFLLALIMGLQTWWIQTGRSVPGSENLWSRLAASGWVALFYLYKALVPVRLVMVYPRWDVNPASLTAWIPLGVVVTGLIVAWRYRQSWGRALALALACYIASLFPVLGIFSMAFRKISLVSDHLQYLALPAITALVAAAIVKLSQRESWRHVAWVGAILIVLAMATLTWQRSTVFRSEVNLWKDTLSKHQDCRVAHINLGAAFQSQKRYSESEEQYRAAADLAARQKKSDPLALAGLGGALIALERVDEAVVVLRNAVRENPEDAESYNNLGRGLLAQNRFGEAVESHRRAVKLKPEFAEAHNNLGRAQLGMGQFQQAVDSHRAALKLHPNMAEAHNDLGRALLALGRLDDAIPCFQKALELKPDLAEAQFQWGNVLQYQGKLSEAAPHYQAAIELLPHYLEAHNNLALALQTMGKLDEAAEHYRTALRLKPDSLEPCFNLGQVLKKQGKLNEAVEYFQRAVRLQPGDAQSQAALGLALAGLARNGEAATYLTQAVKLNPQLASAHNELGKIAAKESKWPEAVEHFRSALAVDPLNAEFQANYKCAKASVDKPEKP